MRFPKGKKVKPGDEAATRTSVFPEEEGSGDFANPRAAATERAVRRNQMTAELFCEDNRGIAKDISVAEVAYEVCLFLSLRWCSCCFPCVLYDVAFVVWWIRVLYDVLT